VGFGEIYPINALDLTGHRIIVGANYQWVLALIIFIFTKAIIERSLNCFLNAVIGLVSPERNLKMIISAFFVGLQNSRTPVHQVLF